MDNETSSAVHDKKKAQLLQSGFDYTNGILPILRRLYVNETPITHETFTEMLNLFKVRLGLLF